MKKFITFDRTNFTNRSLGVESYLSRYLYRLLQGPELALLKANYRGAMDDTTTIPKLQKAVAALQHGGILDYRKEVPNIQLALEGWFKTRASTASLKCYERLAMGIVGIELITYLRHYQAMGHAQKHAMGMAKRRLLSKWDVIEKVGSAAEYKTGKSISSSF